MVTATIIEGMDYRHPSRQSEWPKLRVDLEQRLIAIIQAYIANPSFVSDDLLAFAEKVSEIKRQIDHLATVEAKARAIDTKGHT